MILDHTTMTERRQVSAPLVEVNGWRDAALCLSMANLCLLKVLADLPPFLDQSTLYIQQVPPRWHHYGAYAALLFLIAGGLFMAGRMAGYTGSRGWRYAQRGAWVLAGLVAANSFRHVTMSAFGLLQRSFPGGVRGRLAGYAIALAMLALTGVIWLRAARVRKAIQAALLAMAMLLPANLIAIGTFLSGLAPEGWERRYTAGPAAHGGSAALRVVYLMLDEWDYRLTFEQRPADLPLSGFDELRQGSFFATDARPPGSITIASVPGLLSGRRWQSSRVTAPNRLSGKSSNSTLDLAATDQVFGRLTKAGYAVGIIGWYLPYCRIFSGQFQECRSFEAAFSGYPQTTTLADSLRIDSRYLLESSTRSLIGQPLRVKWTIQTEQALLAALRPMLADAGKDFVYAHLPFLHGPYAYSREDDEFSLRGSPETGYWDALFRTARIIHSLRQELAASPAGARTVLIITSDHPFRGAKLLIGHADCRVPFVALFPAGAESVVFADPLRTETLTAAVDEILSGQIGSPAALQAWVKQRGRAR